MKLTEKEKEQILKSGVEAMSRIIERMSIEMGELKEENRKLRVENEYLHKLLPEADGYVIEKQMEKRLWNDGEEDVYED